MPSLVLRVGRPRADSSITHWSSPAAQFSCAMCVFSTAYARQGSRTLGYPQLPGRDCLRHARDQEGPGGRQYVLCFVWLWDLFRCVLLGRAGFPPLFSDRRAVVLVVCLRLLCAVPVVVVNGFSLPWPECPETNSVFISRASVRSSLSQASAADAALRTS